MSEQWSDKKIIIFGGNFKMNTVIKNTEEKMKKSVQHLETEFSEIRAGRANPAVLDKVKIDYYGVPTAVNQLAAVSVAEARTLTIQPWDKSILRQIEKAIQTSDIGINPQNDGTMIRMIFPPLTEDRRKVIVKEVAGMGEEAKVAIRGIRREAMEKIKALKKKSEITEDDQKKAEKKIQDITDSNIKTIDSLTEKKQKQIMEI